MKKYKYNNTKANFKNKKMKDFIYECDFIEI